MQAHVEVFVTRASARTASTCHLAGPPAAASWTVTRTGRVASSYSVAWSVAGTRTGIVAGTGSKREGTKTSEATEVAETSASATATAGTGSHRVGMSPSFPNLPRAGMTPFLVCAVTRVPVCSVFFSFLYILCLEPFFLFCTFYAWNLQSSIFVSPTKPAKW